MSNKQSKATRRASAQRAQERAAAIRAEQERKERRRRTLVTSVVVVGVLSALLAIGWAVQSARDTTGRAATPPAGVVDTYGLPMGPDSAPVTIEVYEDFMCPFCGQFEAAAGERLKAYAAAGDAQVQYKMISFLDAQSAGADYSTRAMNAVGVVLDEAGAEAALEMHDMLFANQPAEGTEGPTDDELVEMAVKSGADEQDVRGPIETVKFEQWVKNATDQSSKDGVSGTPTVMVDDEVVEYQTITELLEKLDQAVEEKAS